MHFYISNLPFDKFNTCKCKLSICLPIYLFYIVDPHNIDNDFREFIYVFMQSLVPLSCVLYAVRSYWGHTDKSSLISKILCFSVSMEFRTTYNM